MGREGIGRCPCDHERAFRRLAENAREVFWVRDPSENGMTYVNPAFEEIWGRPREELYADFDTLIESIHPEDRTRVSRAMDEELQTGTFDETYRIQRPDGEIRWIHDRGFPVDDSTGNLDSVAGIAADITDRKRGERGLRHQRDRTKRLLDTCPVTILVLDSDRTITFGNERAREVMDAGEIAGTPLEACPWELLDEGEPAPLEKRPFAIVKARGEPVYDLQYRARIDGEIRWLAIDGAPLFEDGFDGAVFAVEDITDRKCRESTLESQREQLERLNHVTDLMRSATDALVGASSREGITTTVCEHLANADQYCCAWIAEDEPPEASVWAGISEATLAGIEDGDESNTARAVATGEPVFDRVPVDSASNEKGDAFPDGRSVAIVPLVHRDRTYGVLYVCTDRTPAFCTDERAVLAELGETIGYAIDAIETRTALASDGVTRLRFTVGDPDCLPVALATESALSHRGIVPCSDGSIRWFLRVENAGRVETTAAGIDRVESVRPITTGEGTLLECVIDPTCLFAPFVHHGATITALSATTEQATITAETAREADIRALCESLESKHGVELAGREDLDRPPRTREERRSALSGELTDRQREILQIAHAGGYFETPRQITGAELAERLDINRSTFHRTLRAAERTTFDVLLE